MQTIEFHCTVYVYQETHDAMSSLRILHCLPQLTCELFKFLPQKIYSLIYGLRLNLSPRSFSTLGIPTRQMSSTWDQTFTKTFAKSQLSESLNFGFKLYLD